MSIPDEIPSRLSLLEELRGGLGGWGRLGEVERGWGRGGWEEVGQVGGKMA